MLRASAFEVVSLQATIFTPESAGFAPARVLANLLQAYGPMYDGPVTALPLPADAPPQLPRIVLQSADSTWKLQIAPARVDVFWSPSGSISSRPVLEDIVERCRNVLHDYARTEHLRVGRLALVVQRTFQAINPAQELVEHFRLESFQQGVLDGSANFELHNHKRYQLPDYDHIVNSWMRCRTAQYMGEPTIAVDQDINTLEEGLADNDFSADAIARFLTTALTEAALCLVQGR